MLRSKLPQLLFLTLLALSNNRCALVGGSEVGNPSADIGLQVVGTNSSAVTKISSPAKSGVNLATGSLPTLTTATIALSRIRFRPFEFCETNLVDELDLTFEGPYVVDLLNNSSTPSLGTIQIPADTYCRIELRMHKLDADEVPAGIASSDPIVGNALYLAGTLPDTTPFQLILEADDTFKLENSTSGFAINDTNLNGELFIAFDLAAWFAGVDLSTATIGDPLVGIILSKDENEALFEQMLENIKTSADLFRDQDDDDSLDDDEDDDDDSLAVGSDD